jgi:hypothetical protein
MFYLLLLPLFLFLAGLLFSRYRKEKRRPQERLSKFKTRFTKNIWSSEQMDIILNEFYDSWVKTYPKDKKKLKKILDDLNIYWVDKRWNFGSNVAIGEILDSNSIQVWKGPLLNKTLPYSYRLIYTALPETLVQYAVYKLNKKKMTHQEILNSYKDILDDIRSKINKVVSRSS